MSVFQPLGRLVYINSAKGSERLVSVPLCVCVCVSTPVSKGTSLATSTTCAREPEVLYSTLRRGQQGIHSSAANEDSCGHSVKQIGTPICVPAIFLIYTKELMHLVALLFVESSQGLSIHASC